MVKWWKFSLKPGVDRDACCHPCLNGVDASSLSSPPVRRESLCYIESGLVLQACWSHLWLCNSLPAFRALRSSPWVWSCGGDITKQRVPNSWLWYTARRGPFGGCCGTIFVTLRVGGFLKWDWSNTQEKAENGGAIKLRTFVYGKILWRELKSSHLQGGGEWTPTLPAEDLCPAWSLQGLDSSCPWLSGRDSGAPRRRPSLPFFLSFSYLIKKFFLEVLKF